MNELMIKLWKYNGTLNFLSYWNERIAIEFVDKNGEAICILTVNLVDQECWENETFLNSNLSWIPIEEIIKVLKDAWIIGETIGLWNSWFCQYPKVKVLKK